MATHIVFWEGMELKIAIFQIYASIWLRIYVIFQACAAFYYNNLVITKSLLKLSPLTCKQLLQFSESISVLPLFNILDNF